METRYIEGNNTEYVLFIQGLGDKAALKVIDGKFRWIVTDDDGNEYIARPESEKNVVQQDV